MKRPTLPLALALALGIGAGTGNAQPLPASAGISQNLAALGAFPFDPATLPAPSVRNGHDILSSFRAGLADPHCDADATSPRWRKHFAHAPARLGNIQDDALPLFGYVVDQLRAAHLPTEFALIPFVESGYRPGARNPSGPTGLWQFIGSTARNHRIPMENGYDGRLSAVDSTQAAVRYLKSLHGMFGGDWRLAVMAYNAGEYRILQSLRRAGMNARNARPAELPGLAPITHAYVEKLHALACVLEQAQHRPELMAALDRPVPVLRSHTLPADTRLDTWAAHHDLDPAHIARLNPAVSGARAGVRVLAPAHAGSGQPDSGAAPYATVAATATAPARAMAGTGSAPAARRHTVRRGESAWSIARRYGIPLKALLSRNNLDAKAALRPGMVLSFEESGP